MTLGEKSKNKELKKKVKIMRLASIAKYWHAKFDIEENAHYPWKTRI